MKQDFQLRDVFNPRVVNELADNIAEVWHAFDHNGFSTTINSRLASFSFGDRNRLIRDTLWKYLPKDYPKAVEILLNALGPEISECDVTGFDGFVVMPQCDFVATYGLDHFDISMNALYEMTKRFTTEWAIRAFIQKYPEPTLELLEHWAEDENCHIRRLVSEGTRPRLPLAGRLPQFIQDPRPVLKLVDKLKADPALIVRRSVANNLNDISKDNPALVAATLGEWQKSADKGTQWIIGHASRTLVKQGYQESLTLLGYPLDLAIRVSGLHLNKTLIHMGDSLNFDFEIHSETGRSQRLVINYVIHHMKANGKTAPKVFKLISKQLKGHTTLKVAHKHPFRPLTTRKYYSGQHALEIQANGTIYARADFDLALSPPRE